MNLREQEQGAGLEEQHTTHKGTLIRTEKGCSIYTDRKLGEELGWRAGIGRSRTWRTQGMTKYGE